MCWCAEWKRAGGVSVLSFTDFTLFGQKSISIFCLFRKFLFFKEVKEGHIELRLFEFDARFSQKYPDLFVHYDYRNPLNVPAECNQRFDLLIADPPFLSDECLIKVAQTIRLLSSSRNAKLLINTGAVMEQLLQRIFADMKRTQFRPLHKNNLANEFSTFSNYPLVKLS